MLYDYKLKEDIEKVYSNSYEIIEGYKIDFENENIISNNDKSNNYIKTTYYNFGLNGEKFNPNNLHNFKSYYKNNNLVQDGFIVNIFKEEFIKDKIILNDENSYLKPLYEVRPGNGGYYKIKRYTYDTRESIKTISAYKVIRNSYTYSLGKLDLEKYKIFNFDNDRSNTPYNYYYEELEYLNNHNNFTKGFDRAIFDSNSRQDFINFINEKELEYLNYFNNINITRNENSYPLFQTININGYNLDIKVYQDNFTNLKAKLYLDINDYLTIYYDDNDINKIKQERINKYLNQKLILNSEINEEINDYFYKESYYFKYANNLTESNNKTTPFIMYMDIFINDILNDNMSVYINDKWINLKTYINNNINSNFLNLYIKETFFEKSIFSNIILLKNKIKKDLFLLENENNLNYIELKKFKNETDYYVYDSLTYYIPKNFLNFIYDIKIYYSKNDKSFNKNNYKLLTNNDYNFIYNDKGFFKLSFNKRQVGFYYIELRNNFDDELVIKKIIVKDDINLTLNVNQQDNIYKNYNLALDSDINENINKIDYLKIYYSDNLILDINNINENYLLNKDDYNKNIDISKTNYYLNNYNFFKNGYYLVKYKGLYESELKIYTFSINNKKLSFNFYNTSINEKNIIHNINQNETYYTNKKVILNINNPYEHYSINLYKKDLNDEYIKINFNNNELVEDNFYKIIINDHLNDNSFIYLINKNTKIKDYEIYFKTNETDQIQENKTSYLTKYSVLLRINNNEYTVLIKDISDENNIVILNNETNINEYILNKELNHIKKYYIKITDKFLNMVEINLIIDNLIPSLSFNQSSIINFNSKNTYIFNDNIIINKNNESDLIMIKNSSTNNQYINYNNINLIDYGLNYLKVISNVENEREYIIYKNFIFNSFILEFLDNKRVLIENDNQDIYFNNGLFIKFINQNPINLYKELKVIDNELKRDILIYDNFKNDINEISFDIQNIENKNYLIELTDIFNKKAFINVFLNNNIRDIDITNLNSENKTNQNIVLKYDDILYKVYLNNQIINLPYTIFENGDYTLRLIDKYNNQKEYIFSKNTKNIKPIIKDNKNNNILNFDFLNDLEYDKELLIELENDEKLYLKDKLKNEYILFENKINNTFLLNENKKYYLKIIDSYNNFLEFNINLILNMENIKNNIESKNFKSNEAVWFSWDNTKIKAYYNFNSLNKPTINDTLYINNTKLEAEGNYNIIFIDNFNREKNYNFKIKKHLESIYIIDNKSKEKTEIKSNYFIINNDFKLDSKEKIKILKDNKYVDYLENQVFDNEDKYLIRILDDFNNYKDIEITYKKLKTIEKEKNKLTIIIGFSLSGVVFFLVFILLILKVKNNIKNKSFNTKRK